MSNKVFIFVIVVIALAFGSIFITSKKNAPVASERPGIEQPDKGREHVPASTAKNTGSEPPTSGPHSSQVPWQSYDQELPDGNVIHNLEHGGIYISYRPDLPADQISKINALFFAPFSRDNFQPNKAIVAPRTENQSPIVMSSWNRSLKLQSFDETKMVEYYLQNIGKAPEAGAQ